MKKRASILVHPLVTLLITCSTMNMHAQCPLGYNQATLNWDYLDYFTYTGNYTSANGYLASNAAVRTQVFAFGTQRVTITQNYADASVLGDNTTHTGETNAYGTGADINFNGNGPVTFTFDNEVMNVKFSIFDIDQSQAVTVTAVNAGSTAQSVTLTKANAASVTIAINPVPATGPTATATAANQTNTTNTNTINVDITGPVKSFTINTSGTAGDYWISDVIACTTGNFPTNYYNVSQPFTNQPGYILHAFDRSVYFVNPATGVTKLLFTDNTTPLGAITATNKCYINSMAYDPYNRIIYYVYSLSASPGTNKLLRKYDLATGTISTVLNDITTIGIPVTNVSGVESGAGAFYNGSWYIGIETPNSGRTSGREAVIWRIDFNGSNVPYRACQVFAVPADNGSGTLMHDWADFTITNGMLYDFDGAGVTTQTDVYHFDMMTGAATNFHLPAGWTPGQPTLDWNNNLYQLYATTTAPTVNPYVAVYNGNGTIGANIPITSTPMYTPAIPSLGDAAEAFRPLCDFGDAPASYDPVALSPAVNEWDTALHIGPTTQVEWLKTSSVLADADADEDGLAYTPIFNPLTGSYVVQVSVYNNTGSNATLIAWLDYNGNGVFDAGEASTPITVGSMASTQSPYLSWPSISSSLPAGSFTYLRIRMTSVSNSMTASNATGYFNNGETEDYRVLVDNVPLAIRLLAFDASWQSGNIAKISWKANEDLNSTGYLLQRSLNGRQWTDINFIPAQKGSGTNNYTYTDHNLDAGKNYYRLKLSENNGVGKYSDVKIVMGEGREMIVTVTPNPVRSMANIRVDNLKAGDLVQLKLISMTGYELYSQKSRINDSSQQIELALKDSWPDGQYILQLITDRQTITRKIIVRK